MKEAGPTITVKNIGVEVAKATGVSESSVRRIIRETKDIESGASTSFSTPHNRTFNDFYIVEKRRPTLKKVHEKLKKTLDFQGCISTLKKIIFKLGFCWKKTKNNRQMLEKWYNIRVKCLQYFRQIKEYREEGCSIIYMDETCIHSSHTTPYAWSDGSSQELFTPLSKGQRFIVIHAGGEQGFIPNAYVRFKSKQYTGDCHSDINYTNYEKWLKSDLFLTFPQILSLSLIMLPTVMYN